eukprot:CAMPEP_0177675606 /NCGR_PEP_ID=MMETSP0447-20121125/27298_1 /TAXON_ID=0 /ORGANISM="Stygamoeba regulata, Strain BSH-02190019" /LENGTH=72 /DNA_ID=CAMNT_0019184019 /DNA_START=832 /DNA_END=1051 /DNA_ORIENTATION=+
MPAADAETELSWAWLLGGETLDAWHGLGRQGRAVVRLGGILTASASQSFEQGQWVLWVVARMVTQACRRGGA